MCNQCALLLRQMEQLKSANTFLRGLNMRLNNKKMLLEVENNNLRACVGVKMQPVTRPQGYLVDWERTQEIEQ